MTKSTDSKTLMDKYVVKPVGGEYLDRAIDIWSLAFGFMDRVRWRFFFESFLDERMGVFDRDYLVAIAGIKHFEMWLGNKLVPAGGISAVACDPAYRRKGLIKLCLKACLQSLHDKHVPVSSLWPFSYPFYAKLGYAVSDFRYSVLANCDVLPDFGDSARYKRIDLDSLNQVKAMHDKWICRHNLSLRRGTIQWTRLINNPQRETSIYQGDDGYLILNTKGQKPRTLEVVEFAYLNKQAFLDGLSLLRRMDDLNFDKVEVTTPDLDEFLASGITYPTMEITYKPGVMARVVHTGAFVDALGENMDHLSAFTVEDPLSVSQSFGGGALATGNKPVPVRVCPGKLIQLAIGVFSEQASEDEQSLQLKDKLSYKKPFCIEFF